MSEPIEPGAGVPALPKGQKAGMSLQLYAGRVMPSTFGQVVEFAQMMAKAGLAIPKHLRDNPGACLSVIQRSLAWEMDPWAVATKTYSVNDILAYEAQLVSAVIKKWAPIQEKVIPYKFEGAGGELRCTITVHHAETGEEIVYRTPLKKDITPQNSPLWKFDPEQQIAYYAIRALARRHFPEILLGVYDREEVMAMKDITPQPVDNFLNDEEPPKREAGPGTVSIEMNASLFPPKPEAENRFYRTPDETPMVVSEESVVLIDKVDLRPGTQPALFTEPADLTPELIAANLEKAVAGCLDKGALKDWEAVNVKAVAELPEPLRRRVRKAAADRFFDLEDL